MAEELVSHPMAVLDVLYWVNYGYGFRLVVTCGHSVATKSSNATSHGLPKEIFY